MECVSDKKFQMRLVAVTGGNGMIGHRIVQHLLRQGFKVRALVRNDMACVEGIEYVTGNITEQDKVRSLLEGVDTVFHCAAELHDDKMMHEVNVEGTKILACTAVDVGVSCFIHMSSAGVVGPSCQKWIDELTPCFPENAYEISKYRAEQVLSEIVLKDMRLCILRPTNVVDSNRPGVLSMAWRNNWKDKVLAFVKGDECAHIVHAEDVSAAAIHLASIKDVSSGVFFVGCDEDKRNVLSETLKICRNIIGGKEGNPIYLPAIIPYWIRFIVRGRSLHGHSRFSSAKLMSTGFEFPLGFDGAILSVCKESEKHF